MSKYEYKAGPRAGFGDEDAAKVGKVIEKYGDAIEPQQLLKEARPKSSPIHHLFCWDDTEAAEQYRLWQARHCIRSIRIIVKKDDVQETKAFHNVVIRQESGDRRAYVHMRTVADDDDLRQQVIQKALAELRGWKARYEEYKSVFGPVFEAIEKAAQRAEVVTPKKSGRLAVAARSVKKQPSVS